MRAHSSGSLERVVVFTDPTNRPDYVRRYVELFHDQWNIRSVLVYPSNVRRVLIAECNGYIGKAGIAARLQADMSNLPGLARNLCQRFEVVAVVPQAEYQVLPVARLCELLDLPWVALDTISRFRNKYDLKQFIRSQGGGPRLNMSQCVGSAAEAFDFLKRNRLSRFVLKPNDGAGNSRIAFFEVRSDPGDVRAYFDVNQGTEVLLEEFIDGPEYCVNGQVDEAGVVRTLSVQRTVYIAGNGRTNLGGGYRMMHSDTTEFALAQAYAAQILKASGLRKSPFHMEIKIDAQGPCMIEVGARLGGAGIPRDTCLAHEGSVDLFREAARCYLVDPPGAPVEPNWSLYDSHCVWTVLGVAPRTEQILNLQGVAEVEALPEFAYWITPPQVGQHVSRTIDLATAPWQVTLRGDSQERMAQVEHFTREPISWNVATSGSVRIRQRAAASVAWGTRRLPAIPSLIAHNPKRVA